MLIEVKYLEKTIQLHNASKVHKKSV